MSVYWWFVVILLTARVSMLGTAWFLGRDDEPPMIDPLEGCDCGCGDVQLPRAGYLPGPPFAGAQDPAYQAPIPWDLAGAAYALGQQRADQDAVSREVDAIMAEIEHNPERWQR